MDETTRPPSPDSKSGQKPNTDQGAKVGAGNQQDKAQPSSPHATIRLTTPFVGKHGENDIYGGHRSSSEIRDHFMQRMQTHEQSLSKKDTAKDAHTTANHNVQIASLKATIKMLEDDLSRRTAELIQANTTIAYKNSEIEELNGTIQMFQDEKYEFAKALDDENQAHKKIARDQSFEISALRNSIHTGIINIGHLYGPVVKKMFTNESEAAMAMNESKAAIAARIQGMQQGHTLQQPSPESTMPSVESTPEHSPKPSPAAPASVSSDSTVQFRMSTSESPLQKMYASGNYPASIFWAVASDRIKPMEGAEKAASDVPVDSKVHEKQEVKVEQEPKQVQEAKEIQDTQESQPSKQSPETEQIKTVQDSSHQLNISDVKPAPINNPPASVPQAANNSKKSKDEMRKSLNFTAPSPSPSPPCSPTHTIAQATPAHPPTAPLPKAQPRSWAHVASSPVKAPKGKPATPRERFVHKTAKPPQANTSATKADKPVKSEETNKPGKSDVFIKTRWRHRTMAEKAGADKGGMDKEGLEKGVPEKGVPEKGVPEKGGSRERSASSKMPHRPNPSFSKAKRNKSPAPTDTRVVSSSSQSTKDSKDGAGQDKAQPAEKEDGWESVKPKHKPKKRKNKGAAQTQGHSASKSADGAINEATNGFDDKPTPNESSHVSMSTKPVDGEKNAAAQSQQKWRRFTGTVIGSNSIFSQGGNKQKGENHSGWGSQGNSHGRNAWGSEATGQQSSPGVPSAKKSFDWADEVEKEQSRANDPNDASIW